MPIFSRSAMKTLFLSLATALLSATAGAQTGLTVIPGPNGGRVVYGPVTGVTTVPAAMGAVLRSLHNEFHDRPQVGRVFEVRDSGSSAVYFALQPPGAKPVAGLVIVSPAAQSGFEAGIVFDDPARLPTSFNPMLQTLMQAWHPDGGGAAARGNGTGAGMAPPQPSRSSAPAAPLQTFTLPDQTASVGLPPGWRINRNSAGGTIIADGPNGEIASLGYSYLAIDTSTPQGRNLQQQSLGPLRNTSYASSLYYPYGGSSLGRIYVDLNRMAREKARLPPAQVRIDSDQPIDARSGSRCALLRGEVQVPEKPGPMAFTTLYCVAPPMGGSWMSLAYQTAAPVAIADRERATLAAIAASFRENTAAIQRLAGQIAAPGIAQIREIGRQATIRAAQADATRIGMRQSYEARSDSQDRRSQAFSNYIRDQTTIIDRDHNTHDTLWNQSADSLVRTDPKRYGYVDTPGFWKGVDY